MMPPVNVVGVEFQMISVRQMMKQRQNPSRHILLSAT